MLESGNSAHKSWITSNDNPWHQKWPHPPSIQSGTINILQVWLRERTVLDTLLFMLESWNLAHKSRITYHDDSWCQEWPHPPCIQSGTFNVLLSMASRMGSSWYFGGYPSNFRSVSPICTFEEYLSNSFAIIWEYLGNNLGISGPK